MLDRIGLLVVAELCNSGRYKAVPVLVVVERVRVVAAAGTVVAVVEEHTGVEVRQVADIEELLDIPDADRFLAQVVDSAGMQDKDIVVEVLLWVSIFGPLCPGI